MAPATLALTISPSAGAALAAPAPRTPAVRAATLPAATAAAKRAMGREAVGVRMPFMKRGWRGAPGTRAGAAGLRWKRAAQIQIRQWRGPQAAPLSYVELTLDGHLEDVLSGD